MIIKVINALEEMQGYYNKEANIYDFYDIHLIIFNYDLNVEASIIANDIYAWNIKALYVDACNIRVNNNIEANAIDCCDLCASYIGIRYIDACNIKADSVNALMIKTRVDINVYNIKSKTINARNIITTEINAKYINAVNVIKL